MASPEPIQIPLVWLDRDDLPILFVNQVMGQLDDHGDVIISLGQAMPPAVVGPPEDQAKQVQGLGYVGVKPVARISVSASRLRDLIRVLDETLTNHGQVQGAIGRRKEEGDQ